MCKFDTLCKAYDGSHICPTTSSITPSTTITPSTNVINNTINAVRYEYECIQDYSEYINGMKDIKEKLEKVKEEMTMSVFQNYCESHKCIFSVTNVEVYNNCVVKVTFGDGTFTKSVCSKNDKFDFDVGVTICLLKKYLEITIGKKGAGTRLYNKAMNDIHDLMKMKEKDMEAEKKLAKERKEKEWKRQERSRIRNEKAKAEWVDIIKTAYLEAIKEDEDA